MAEENSTFTNKPVQNDSNGSKDKEVPDTKDSSSSSDSSTSSKSKASSLKIEEGPKLIVPVFEQREALDEQIQAQIIVTLSKFTDKSPPTKISESLKSMLDSKFGKGWCVFAGAHFSGSCTFEEKYFAQITFGTYTITLFRIFIPNQ
ncbi:dynein light chain [Ordospora colligata]|uniref:Dynein light chain n=1 Tax=Ordospora colligata OC4 TaxID=1354746 RepID=A0A0B2UH22_9MICR|nr:dynein light chain [Ordospora colligata OC4]KHN70361.1 dynein light chain [Ordospora colligata OC4]TBU17111.1 dynein light chain [Ordospora colligata]TBU17361.1 dynein light chain [Ordospora colligata]TBU19541.1 dynein light chain [Ordospora colligata]